MALTKKQEAAAAAINAWFAANPEATRVTFDELPSTVTKHLAIKLIEAGLFNGVESRSHGFYGVKKV